MYPDVMNHNLRREEAANTENLEDEILVDGGAGEDALLHHVRPGVLQQGPAVLHIKKTT